MQRIKFTHLHLVIALAAAPIYGFAPVRLPKTSVQFQLNKSLHARNQNMMLNSAAASSLEVPTFESRPSLNKIQSTIVRVLMSMYIASMCVALPVTLFPLYLLYKSKLIDLTQKENWSMQAGQLCSRWLMRIFPFASKRVIVNSDDKQLKNPEPCIWVCNHISMLDLFFLLALDKKMRGKSRRPMKILYWKGLEDNPVTNIFCKMCGFIPVDMAANGNGNENEYDTKSLKKVLVSTKRAMKEGFDIGILPEGQPNPTPEKGLQRSYSGAFSFARLSRRPIKMISLYGLHRMWHPDTSIGMKCDDRKMAVRVYPNGRVFKDSEEFTSTFEAVVGHFGAHGYDMPDEELEMWLDGSMWKTELSRRTSTRFAAEYIEHGEESTIQKEAPEFRKVNNGENK